jgi:hypothetical protein
VEGRRGGSLVTWVNLVQIGYIGQRGVQRNCHGMADKYRKDLPRKRLGVCDVLTEERPGFGEAEDSGTASDPQGSNHQRGIARLCLAPRYVSEVGYT